MMVSIRVGESQAAELDAVVWTDEVEISEKLRKEPLHREVSA
jgi:hypothetical protein